jgi:L-threonylcarbamoyladenylate synthase
MAEIGTNLRFAEMLLRKGEVVAIPTETVYGLAGNAFDEDALLKIFSAKNRPHFNPMIAHCSGWEMVEAITGKIPPLAVQLAEAFWPGPLSLLLPRNERIPDLLTAGSPLLAVRQPAHPLSLQLLRQLDFPLAAPSANPFGYISPTTAAHVQAQLGEKIPYILDGGPTLVGIESTIIGFDAMGKAIVYRLGGLSLEEIEEVVGPLSYAPRVQDRPEAPGRLKSHYAPQTPLVLDGEQPWQETQDPQQVGAIVFQRPLPDIPPGQQFILSPGADLAEAAKNLFSALREMDQRGYALIVAERLPEEGLGRAINDRLERAQHKFK